MNTDTAVEILATIAATSARKEKEEIIGKNPGLRSILDATYNPFRNYGVLDFDPRSEPAGSEPFSAMTWFTLEDMAARRLSGLAAIEALKEESRKLTAPSQDLLRRILVKDLECGIGPGTINKAFPGLIPEFPYMRCTLLKDAAVNEFDWARGVYSQEKADGMYFNVTRLGTGEFQITSRQGTQFPLMPFLPMLGELELVMPIATQLHGEILVTQGGKILPREVGNGILNSVQQGGAFEPGTQPLYLVWDKIPLSSVRPKGEFHGAYADRCKDLDDCLACGPGHYVRMIETRIVHSLADAFAHYKEKLAQGKEGTIIKHPHAIWKDGTSKEQVKLKLEVDVDLEIMDFLPGTGKNKDLFGSIRMKSRCGLLVVDVTGFKDAERKKMHAERAKLVGMVGTVKANQVMTPSDGKSLHSLFLPRFVEVRHDKDKADSLVEVIAQFASAVRAAA